MYLLYVDGGFQPPVISSIHETITFSLKINYLSQFPDYDLAGLLMYNF